ncbi:hypothetical protein QTO30_04740 [Yoonia sp. GPGPB17]|uniref:hypothetical protein n=1 Tax=Yoonia sp. GPGPB17 TaxID=3026147 RepID=UPI0030C2D4CF
MRNFGVLYINLIVIALILFLAAIVTPVILVGAPAYVAFQLWRDSPARLERLAKEETEQLYRHALRGRIELSEADIDSALSAHWPQSTPAALRIQLLNVGRAIFADEGLSPDIPPPPLLCNTVEGGRYRDALARAGQARHDRVMQLSALDRISQSLYLL